MGSVGKHELSAPTHSSSTSSRSIFQRRPSQLGIFGGEPVARPFSEHQWKPVDLVISTWRSVARLRARNLTVEARFSETPSITTVSWPPARWSLPLGPGRAIDHQQ